MKKDRIAPLPLAGFCLTAFAIQALAILIIVFLPEYYATAMALPVAAVGTAFMTVRVLDLFIDPVLGAMMDATRTRWGRFRPWLAASAPVLMISVYVLFETLAPVSVAFLWAWLFVAFIGFSMIVLAHLAWTATLANVPTERTRIFAWWQIFATGGQFSILLILPIVSRYTGNDPAAGIHAVGYVLCGLIPVAIALALFSLPEHPPVAERPPVSGPRDYLAALAQPTVRRILGADLALGMSQGVSGAVLLFFYMGQLGFDRATASGLVVASYGAAFLGTPIFARLANRLGKAQALSIGASAQGLLQLAIAAQPAQTPYVTVPTVLVLGLCLPIALFLPRALMADVAEDSVALLGADRTGLLFATLNGTMKLALGLAVGFAFVLLDWLEFNPADVASPANALPLRLLVGVVPAILSFSVIAFMYRYPSRTAKEFD